MDFTGGRAVISDERTGLRIANATVRAFDPETEAITVDGRLVNPDYCRQAVVLLFKRGRVYQYDGEVHASQHSGLTDILLSNGRPKEDRAAPRNRVNVPARVEWASAGGQEGWISPPLEVTVRNISTGGLFFRGMPRAFPVGARLRLRMEIGGQDTRMLLTVIHTGPPEDLETSGYGCKLLFVE